MMDQHKQSRMSEIDCLTAERLLTTLAGFSLVVYAFTLRSLAAMLLLFSGSYLVLRGLSGEGFLCDLQKQRKRPDVFEESEVPQEVTQGDMVTEASWESFPASDPPAWTSG